MNDLQRDEFLTSIRPTKRQIDHQSLEFYAFVHFTVNTFTGNEWGDGNEDESIFNPINFDAKQWVDAIKSAGMKGLILTCKHHDGFCLWPSKYTSHCVSSSPFKRDIVKEVSDACRESGIRFGVYYSPWDRNCAVYGMGKEYDDYFCNQLTELLTNYGEVFSVWFDGACGEGPNGKKQYYDWERYYKLIRELQPNACISVCGPDVRWCGNEAGYTRPSEWSVVPKRTTETEMIASRSQQSDDTEFRTREIHAYDYDLGSREILKDENELVWYPAEVNTSIRPGWFYHDYEDDKVRSLDDLMNVYFGSVGGNSTFLLNIPPNKEGLFHENDVKRLKEIGEFLENAFGKNLLDGASVTASSEKKDHRIESALADGYDCFYMADEITPTIEIKFNEPTKIKYVTLKENIALSQRIESFEIYADEKLIYQSSIVGHKKIARLEETLAKTLTIKITDSRCEPTLSFIGIY